MENSKENTHVDLEAIVAAPLLLQQHKTYGIANV